MGCPSLIVVKDIEIEQNIAQPTERGRGITAL